MNEESINKRIAEIISAYAEVITEDIDSISFEAITRTDDENLFTGEVKVTVIDTFLNGDRHVAEKIIKPTDDLKWVSDFWGYPEWIGRQSKNIDSNSVKMAYFDDWGNLIVEHTKETGGGTEKFRIKDTHKDEIHAKLKLQLKDKLKI